MFGPGICWSGPTLNRCGRSNGAGQTQARRKPSKELREAQQRKPEAGQRNPERYQRKTLPRIGPFQWVTTIRGKNPLLPASPGAAPRGGSFGDRTTLSVVSDNRKKKSTLPPPGSYGVMCWSTGLLFVRRTLAVMAGLVPAIHAGPPQERVPPRRDRREGGGRKAFRACLRRCAGPSWMAGTSPAMTPRWRRPPSPPCSQFLPHNSQGHKSEKPAPAASPLTDGPLTRPSRGPRKRKLPPGALAGRLTVARLFELACVDALGLRGWPGQARP